MCMIELGEIPHIVHRDPVPGSAFDIGGGSGKGITKNRTRPCHFDHGFRRFAFSICDSDSRFADTRKKPRPGYGPARMSLAKPVRAVALAAALVGAVACGPEKPGAGEPVTPERTGGSGGRGGSAGMRRQPGNDRRQRRRRQRRRRLGRRRREWRRRSTGRRGWRPRPDRCAGIRSRRRRGRRGQGSAGTGAARRRRAGVHRTAPLLPAGDHPRLPGQRRHAPPRLRVARLVGQRRLPGTGATRPWPPPACTSAPSPWRRWARRPRWAGVRPAPASRDRSPSFRQLADWFTNKPGTNYVFDVQIPLYDTGRGTVGFRSLNFFPIDGKGWNDQLKARGGALHNFGFTTHVLRHFTYRKGQTFTFTGDDDVWVYVEGKQVIDLGGLHPSRSRTVNLDDISRRWWKATPTGWICSTPSARPTSRRSRSRPASATASAKIPWVSQGRPRRRDQRRQPAGQRCGDRRQQPGRQRRGGPGGRHPRLLHAGDHPRLPGANAPAACATPTSRTRAAFGSDACPGMVADTLSVVGLYATPDLKPLTAKPCPGVRNSWPQIRQFDDWYQNKAGHQPGVRRADPPARDRPGHRLVQERRLLPGRRQGLRRQDPGRRRQAAQLRLHHPRAAPLHLQEGPDLHLRRRRRRLGVRRGQARAGPGRPAPAARRAP